MSVFVETRNPMTGAYDYELEDEQFDYHQDVARASFADMLHDKERNEKFEQGLILAIKEMHRRGRRANVLDIGAGTGLLSMMAVRNGADSVTACEAFTPMSQCALKIISENGFGDWIKLIPKRSTDLSVGEDGDLEEKCNILVAEVFDTELIGELALSTFDHAHNHLMEEDSIVIPDSALIYVQIVECPLAQNWNKLKNIYSNEGELLVSVPTSIKNCTGSTNVHDLQLSQLPVHSFNTIVSPTAVLKFDFSGQTPICYENMTVVTVTAERDGVAQCAFMWWELNMDRHGEVILSCAPHWAHPLTKHNKNAKIPWRDHWMQAIYYLPKEVKFKKGQNVKLLTCHDEYLLSFSIMNDLETNLCGNTKPMCRCGLHNCFSYTRIGQINNAKRNKKFLSLFDKYVNGESVILVLGDGFFVALAAAKVAKKIYVLEPNCISTKIFQEFIDCNNFKNVEVLSDIDIFDIRKFDDVNVILSEPNFISSTLPWHNLCFVWMLNKVRSYLPGIEIFPKKAVVKAVAVHFFDLYKIRMPLGTCEGFVMTEFDRIMENSTAICDEAVEPQPLWEYPGIALSTEVTISELNWVHNPLETCTVTGSITLEGDLTCNGVALWVEWDFDGTPRHTFSTGPVTPIEIGQKVNWDMYTRQGVTLFVARGEDINYKFKFDASNGRINFKIVK